MQVILNETEYAEYLTLKEQNSELSHKLAVANDVREKDHEQINGLCEKLNAYRKTYDSMNKILCEKSHEILVLNAELANLSSQVRSLVEENQTYCNQIAEMKRDCEGTSKVLEETKKLSAKRLEVMNSLIRTVRNLKTEHVCIATNPQNGHVKVVSVGKADTYRKFGWLVSEEYLVDRPA